MLSSGKISDRHRPEQQKYLRWYAKEKGKGLVSVSITSEKALAEFLGEEYARNLTSEDVYKELNTINDAIESGKFKVVAEVDENGVRIKDDEFF